MEPWLESFARANFRRSGDTAHDLKTPLNVAVLNLELLRMRLRKVAGDDDEKINNYTSAIETELRRMGRIFDTFFLLSTPPKNEGEPIAVDAVAIAAEAADAAGFAFERGPQTVVVTSHESRIRQAVRMFFEGASKVLRADGRSAAASQDNANFTLTAVGFSEPSDLDLTKIFKFYYTDPQGSPDLTLAAARLIAETYGGELNASSESGKVSLRLTLPLGER